MTTLIRRFLAVLALDARVFEEVEADRHATGQAFLVVLLASLGAGLGNVGVGNDARPALAAIAIGSVAAWAAWATLVYLLGTKVLPERGTSADFGEVFRTIGFAAAPGALRAFEVFGGTRWFVLPITAGWMLAAMVIAIRQALDYTSTTRAIALSLLGWAVSFGVAIVVGLLLARPVS